MVVATLLFLSRSGSYKYAEPQGSPLTVVFRVFVAFASKMFCPLPRDANQLHENRHNSHLCASHPRPQVPSLLIFDPPNYYFLKFYHPKHKFLVLPLPCQLGICKNPNFLTICTGSALAKLVATRNLGEGQN
jgi:hypothetical protein